jgi:iron(III) transport system substrate-binding protein
MTNTTTKRAFGFRSLTGAFGVTVTAVTLVVATAGAAPAPHSTPKKPVPVVNLSLYSAQGYDSYVVAAFNAANPSIHITLNDNSTGTLLTQIAAEQDSGNPTWNMMWADGATWAAQFDVSGWTKHGILPSGVNFNTAGLTNLPSNKSFVPTGVTVTGGLCYDTAATQGVSLPSTFAGLVNMPNGSLGMNNPSLSGPTYPLIAGEMAHLAGISSSTTKSPSTAQVTAGIKAGEKFLKALKAKGLQVHNTNGPTLGAMESNPATLSAATIQTSACYGDIAAGYWPTGAVKYLDYSVALPSTIAVSNDVTPAQFAAAKKFIAFVLSPQGQRTMQAGDPQGDGLFWPVISGVDPEQGLPSYASTNAYAINPYVWGPLQDIIDSWFTNNIVN